MCNFEHIKHIIRGTPICFIRLLDVEMENYSLKDIFSFTIRKSQGKIFKKSSLVLIQSNDCLWLAFVKSKQPVSSIDTRIVLHHLKKTKWKDTDILKENLEKNHITELENYTQNDYAKLSQKLSEHLLRIFADDYFEFLENYIIPNKEVNNSIMQSDAINLAISISGMDNRNITNIEINDAEETKISNFVHLLEDNVISYEFNAEREGLVKNCSPTGKITFENGNEKLTIYTANKLPLERVLGVDLIYINDTHKNIVMLQYKMLTKESDKWIYRFDQQLYDEIERMDSVVNTINSSPSSNIDDFRLNNHPFFLRFIKNQSSNGNIISFNISLEHFKMIKDLPMCRGERNGRLISYENINKHYIGKQELEALIRCGYIGTHQYDTEELSEIIELISNNLNNHSLVIAFKEKLQNTLDTAENPQC